MPIESKESICGTVENDIVKSPFRSELSRKNVMFDTIIDLLDVNKFVRILSDDDIVSAWRKI